MKPLRSPIGLDATTDCPWEFSFPGTVCDSGLSLPPGISSEPGPLRSSLRFLQSKIRIRDPLLLSSLQKTESSLAFFLSPRIGMSDNRE
ncbi:hypothetical protein AAC387_Pa01g1185 [Persea americana]